VQAKTRATQSAQVVDPYYDPLPVGLFMVVDVIALGVAGFAAGCLGFFFLSFSLKPKTWPGMFALDLCCILGLGLVKG
jgi:hypothetical protein